MKPLLSFLTLIICLAGVTASADDGPTLIPGLKVIEYPRHSKQKNNESVYLDPEEFDDPIGEAKVALSLDPMIWTSSRNAIASGFLEVEETGKYAFSTDSFYDRNLLMINGKIVCHFADGGDQVKTIKLPKGRARISLVGYVEGRGKANLLWRPPGQRELKPIPEKQLSHLGFPPKDTTPNGITIVAKDFVLEIYKNGERIPDEKRKLLLDRFGATAERADVDIKAGDWLVFHVANNRLRHGGTKFFALSASRSDSDKPLVSDPKSSNWSICDQPEYSAAFIKQRYTGSDQRAVIIDKPWEEGTKFMRQYAGTEFSGSPLWGNTPSTWIKVVVPGAEKNLPNPAPKINGGEIKSMKLIDVKPLPKSQNIPIEDPKRWPVQVLSAVYGTGGKNADVTEIVRSYVQERKFFASNPKYLKADPNPYWNKGLRIVYMKDGVRREQRRNENEHILPESFYGPHDPAELEKWLQGTRWVGPLGEIQFHPGQLLTGSDLKSIARWEPLSKNKLRVTWGKNDEQEYRFDYTWSSFKDPEDGKDTYRIVN